MTRSFTRNVGLSAVAIGFGSLAVLICVPVLARNLEPARFGQVNLIILLVNLAAGLDGLRLPFVKLIHGEGRFRHVLRAGRSVAAALGTLSFAILLGITLGLGLGGFGAFESVCIGLSVFGWMLGSAYAGVLVAAHRVGVVQLIRAVGIGVTYVVFAALSFRTDHVAFYAATTLAVFVAMLIALVLLADAGRWPDAPGGTAISSIKRLGRDASSLVTYQGMASLSGSLDGLLITGLLGNALFGMYNAHQNITVRLNLLAAVVSRVVFPRLSEDLGERRLEEYSLALRGVAWLQLSLSSAVFLYSARLSELLFGAEYAPYHFVIRVVVLGVTVQLMGYFGPALLNALGDFSTQTRCGLVGLILMAVAGPFLVRRFGIAGGAATYLIGRVSDLFLGYSALGRLHGLSPGVAVNLLKRLALFLVVWSSFLVVCSILLDSAPWTGAVCSVLLLAAGPFLLLDKRERRAVWAEWSGLRQRGREANRV